MKYLEFFIIPALMITDYYLTIFGDRIREKGHSRHYKFGYYELNPIWINDVKKRKKLNIRHLCGVVLVSLIFGYFYFTEYNSVFYRVLYGAVLTVFVIINLRHICNIILFRFIIKNPDEIRGQITLSTKYVYTLSALQHLTAAGIILPLTILSRSYYVFGALMGSVILIFVQII